MSVSYGSEPRFRPLAPRVLFDLDPAVNLDEGYDVNRDGTRFYIVESNEPPPPNRIELVVNWFEELESLVPVQ